MKAITASKVSHFGAVLFLHLMLQSHVDAKRWARAVCSMQVWPPLFESNYKKSHSDQILQAREKPKRERVPQPNSCNGIPFCQRWPSSPLRSNCKVRAPQWTETSPPFLFSQGAQQDEQVSQLWTWILNGKSLHISFCTNKYANTTLPLSSEKLSSCQQATPH